MTLGEYLSIVGGRPWAWGRPKDDCCEFAAWWWSSLGNPDPMAMWRGKYRSENGARRVIKRNGGLLRIWIDTLGPPGNGPAREGDVAIVTLAGHEAGAIYTGRRWAIRSERGWVAASLDSENVLGIWNR